MILYRPYFQVYNKVVEFQQETSRCCESIPILLDSFFYYFSLWKVIKLSIYKELSSASNTLISLCTASVHVWPLNSIKVIDVYINDKKKFTFPYSHPDFVTTTLRGEIYDFQI